MTESRIISTNNYEGKRTAIIRNGMDSFEIIINKVTGITEVWKAQFKKLERGYEEEVFPKLIFKGDTKSVKSKYKSPKEMINNYIMNGLI